MVKTATVTIGDDGQIASGAPDPLDGIDSITAEEANQAFAITDELRGTAGITLQFVRVWPNTPGMTGHCGEMASEEYSLAEVTRRYGPGRYVVRLKGPDNRYMKGGGKLNIAGNPTSASAGPAQAPTGGAGDVVQLLEAMNRRQDDQQRAADARREKFWALALAAIPVIPSIVTAMKGGGSDLTTALITALKPAPQMTPADMVGMLSQLKELSGGSDKADPIDQLSKLLTVARDLGGGGDSGGSSNWIDLVRDGLKAAPDILSGMQRAGPQVVQVQSVPGAPLQPQAQIPQSEPAQPAPQEGQDMWVLIQPVLRNIAASIEGWARDGKDAALRAEVLLDDLPKWLADRLKPEEALVFLNHPQWWEHLTAFHPPLAQYRAWIDDMRAELIELVKEQIKEAATPPASENTAE